MSVEVKDPDWFGRVLRHAVGLAGHATQAAYAEACGVSLNTVVNVLTGSRWSYRQSTVQALAGGLVVPTGRLVRLAGTDRPRDAAVAALRLMADDDSTAGDAVQGEAARFLVSVEGVDPSTVEAALGATIARLARRKGAGRASLRVVR